MFKDFSWGTALSVAVGFLVVGLVFFGLHWLMMPAKPTNSNTGTQSSSGSSAGATSNASASTASNG